MTLPEQDDPEVLSLARAAEHLGVSPTVLARLLDTGALAWQPTDDVLTRTVRLVDLEAHRDARFALRQKLTQEQRALGTGDQGPWETWDSASGDGATGSGAAGDGELRDGELRDGELRDGAGRDTAGPGSALSA